MTLGHSRIQSHTLQVYSVVPVGPAMSALRKAAFCGVSRALRDACDAAELMVSLTLKK